MDSPVFRIEGIVKTKDELIDFEGPLTLILQLLSKNRIEIRDISVSLILEQYLEYLEAMAEMDLDIASEFVAMASHLMFIKTKMLLGGNEEISELEQLISSLEELRRGDIYAQIKEIAGVLSGMYTRGAALMPGPPEYLPPDTEYRYTHSGADLLAAIMSVIGREDAAAASINPRETTYPRRITYSIPDKIAEILEKLKSAGDIPVSEFFLLSASRTELIATFVAILELCKVGSVFLIDGGDDLIVTYTGAGREPEITADSIPL